MKGNLYIIIFALVLGVVCATLLTFVSQITATARQNNEDAEKMRNIFTALKIDFDKKASFDELKLIYENNITEKELSDLKIYQYAKPDDKDNVLATAIELQGPGMWGPVEGFLALEPDMKTIRGITFYKQEETPGLGGEISTESFQKGFSGKSIYDAAGNPGIVIKGEGADDIINQVDAISGATITCGKVQELINVSISKLAEAENG